MRKTLFFTLALICCIGGCNLFAQSNLSSKISPDLLEKMAQSDSSDEMFRIVILMNEQFDAKKATRQTRYLNKVQKRAFVVNELQRMAKNGQENLLEELSQGQRSQIVEEIKSFWIFNGIYCSTTKEMVHAIAERQDVGYITEEGYFHIADGEESEDNVVESTAENQWNVVRVNADDVWDMGYTGKGIIVAVIDTGVNYDHTDIADNMWDGGEEFPHHGWDFINDDNDPMDDHRHGTHCAGTVASRGTNGKQCGIAKDAQIMALKTMGADGGSKMYTWAAIQFAVSHGADILSLSLGADGTGGDYEDRIVMENVLNCGIVAAVAAGNVGHKLSTYPVPYNIGSPGNNPSPWHHPDQTQQGGHSATITVGNLDSSDTKYTSSSIGPATWTMGDYIGTYYDYPWEENNPNKAGLIKPDISAPGTNIVSLSHNSNSGYLSMTGTSMATPCVAGIMALLLEANPTLTPLEIDSIIETTAVACESQTSKNNRVGSGRIDALAAISYMLNVCAAPTNLVATVVNGFDVELNWVGATDVGSYRIYRNNTVIAQSVEGTTYIDENAPAGENIYFIRSNCDNSQTSLPSNQIVAIIGPSHTPSHLEAIRINTDEHTIDLEWNKLCYSRTANGSYNFGEECSAAQRFPKELLKSFAGMKIEHFYFGVRGADQTCIVRFYEGDNMTTGTLVHQGSYTTTEEYTSIDYALSQPIPVNPNKALWVTVTTSGALYADFNHKGIAGQGNDAFYYRFPSHAFWDNYPHYAWCFQLEFKNDNDYKYKLYRNGTSIATDIEANHTTTDFAEGVNKYQVSAYNDTYESMPSNSIIIVDGNVSTDELILAEDDNLYGLEGSSLTVSGTLVSTNPDHFILEDGAQLINDSEGVKATVKKHIMPYSEDKQDGWNLIASPVTEDITPTIDNGILSSSYDLYYFDQSGTDDNGKAKEWRNFEALPDSKIEHKTGYLYANSEETTLSFAGTLAGIAEDTELTLNAGTDFAGFNLIGNPYPCNAYANKPFYVLQYNQEEDKTSFVLGNNPIPPCSAILMQAQENGEDVTFSKTPIANLASISMKLSMADRKSTNHIDQARISFQANDKLSKYTWGNVSSTISIPQNGQDLAVACANGENEMPLNFKAAKNGTYTLAFEVENLDLDYLHLIDNMTGEDVDLLLAGASTGSATYTFEAMTTDFASRFKLVFAEPTDGPSADDQPFAYYANGEIRIVADVCDAFLQVVDVTGRVVASVGGHTRCVPTTGMVPGVYVLRLISGDNVRTQKIVIE